MNKIKPTIGRVVWFYPPGHREGNQPHAAQIAFVHIELTRLKERSDLSSC